MKKGNIFFLAGFVLAMSLGAVFFLIGPKALATDEIDNSPPQAIILSYVHSDYTNDKLYFDIYDVGNSGIASAQLFKDGVYVMDISSPYNFAAYDTSGLADGSYQLEVAATDAAGNTATSSPYAMVIDHNPPPPDTIAPNVTILSVVNNKIYTDIYDNEGGSGIATVKLYVNGVLNKTITPPDSYDLIIPNVNDLADGDYDIFISAADNAGNWVTSSVKKLTVVDAIAPITADNVPAGSQTGSATITFACADNSSGCKRTYYTTDGTDPSTESSYVDASNSWQFSSNSIGSYTIKYFSIDNDGNMEAIKTAANILVIIPQPTPPSRGGGGGGSWLLPITTTTSTTTADTATSTISTGDNSTSTEPIITETTSTASSTGSPQVLGVKIYNFKRNLGFGSRGADVKELQLFLIEKNVGPAAAALAKIGATGYFGILTRKALAEYQKSVNIKPASGYFGAITRSYVNKLY